MDFRIPVAFEENLKHYKKFLSEHLTPDLTKWYADKQVPRDFFRQLGARDWLGLEPEGNGYREHETLKEALIQEHLGIVSPGVGWPSWPTSHSAQRE